MSSGDPSQFEALADQFVREIREGLDPQVSDYAERHPGVADQIRRLFPVLRRMESPGESLANEDSAWLQEELQQIRSLPPLRQLGDYRIIREIGRGGMGIVYEAEQVSLGRRVALKVLPDTVQFDERRRQRFQQEARAAAMLHHTNIIPVFGIGCSDQLSYFVMQYIDGQPLDAVLRELSEAVPVGQPLWTIATQGGQATLSTEVSGLFSDPRPQPPDALAGTGGGGPADSDPSDRPTTSSPSLTLSHDDAHKYWRSVARIGRQVASALAHAHSHGILHRDIKPSNLLLDESGSVWVTDFGLAKYLESPDLTRTGEFVGTLRYMSPEHLRGTTDARSDIFSLGLTLYELAALRPAYDATDRNDLMRQVGQGTVRSLRAVQRQAPRDLETIIGKCLAPEPSGRYPTATALENDLARFLAGEPIHARQTSAIERAVKWCQRRPAIAALLAALAVSVGLGFAGIAWQWRRTASALKLAEGNLDKANTQHRIAKQHFAEARDAVNKFFTIVSQQRLLREPGLQPLRQELLNEALHYHQAFAAQYQDEEDLKADLAASLYYIAEIEGQIHADGDQHVLLDRPLALFQELAAADPTNPQYPVWVSRCQSLKSRFLARQNTQASLDWIQQSIATLENARQRLQDPLLGGQELAKQYQELGLYWEAAGRATQETEKSLEYYSKALAEREALQAAWPDDLDQTITIASLQRDLGITYRRMGDFDRAVQNYDLAMKLLEEVVSTHPDHEFARRTLASVGNTVGFYYGTGAPVKNYDRALACYQSSADQYAALVTLNPLLLEYQEGLARALQNAGDLLHAQGKLEEGLALQMRSETIRRELATDYPSAMQILSSWGVSMNGVGSTLRDLGRHGESMEWHQRAHQQHVQVVTTDPGQAVYRLRLIDGVVQQARTLCALDDFAAAMDVLKTIGDFALPEHSQPFFIQGRDFMLIACKIGQVPPDDRTPTLDALREESLLASRRALVEAAGRGQDVVQSWQVDGTIQHFAKFPECQEIHDWLASGGLRQ